MGFLSGMGAVAGAALTGGPFGAAVGSVLPGMVKGIGQSTQQQSAPEIDPDLKRIRDAQIKRAKDYRNNIEGVKEQQYQQAAEGSRQDLAGKLAGIKSNMNQRGLLYSGLNQQAQIGAGAEGAAELSAKRAQINDAAENQAQGLENQALGTGFAVQGAQQQLNDTAFQSNLARSKLRQDMANGLVGAATKGIGMAIGAA